MPLTTMHAETTVDQMMDAIARACKKANFRIDEEHESRMNVSTGSLAMSIFFGIFVLYANCAVKVKEDGEGEVKASFEWGNPWWQGVFGPMRARSAVKGLVDEVERAVEKDGGHVTGRKDG